MMYSFWSGCGGRAPENGEKIVENYCKNYLEVSNLLKVLEVEHSSPILSDCILGIEFQCKDMPKIF